MNCAGFQDEAGDDGELCSVAVDDVITCSITSFAVVCFLRASAAASKVVVDSGSNLVLSRGVSAFKTPAQMKSKMAPSMTSSF